MSQKKYVEQVIDRFNTKGANHINLSKKSCPKTNGENEKMVVVLYSSAVGSIMYSMVCTRPDIAHVVGVVSKFLSSPGKNHWEAIKWIFIYLKGTSKRLCFGGTTSILQRLHMLTGR